jgi:hypothetical protein
MATQRTLTRLAPYFWSNPLVILYAPWYSATSSPRIKTSSSRSISSSSAELRASRTVIDPAALELDENDAPPAAGASATPADFSTDSFNALLSCGVVGDRGVSWRVVPRKGDDAVR